MFQSLVHQLYLSGGFIYYLLDVTQNRIEYTAENADPDVIEDILMGLKRMVPENVSYAHLEGNSPAHIKASLMGSSVLVVVEGGKLLLGTWQGIFLVEFDGPRHRKVIVKGVRA